MSFRVRFDLGPIWLEINQGRICLRPDCCTAASSRKRYNWNIVESGVKHHSLYRHKPKPSFGRLWQHPLFDYKSYLTEACKGRWLVEIAVCKNNNDIIIDKPLSWIILGFCWISWWTRGTAQVLIACNRSWNSGDAPACADTPSLYVTMGNPTGAWSFFVFMLRLSSLKRKINHLEMTFRHIYCWT